MTHSCDRLFASTNKQFPTNSFTWLRRETLSKQRSISVLKRDYGETLSKQRPISVLKRDDGETLSKQRPICFKKGQNRNIFCHLAKGVVMMSVRMVKVSMGEIVAGQSWYYVVSLVVVLFLYWDCPYRRLFILTRSSIVQFCPLHVGPIDNMSVLLNTLASKLTFVKLAKTMSILTKLNFSDDIKRLRLSGMWRSWALPRQMRLRWFFLFLTGKYF